MGVIDRGPVRTRQAAAPMRRLLVVEDECLVAFSLVDDLVELGYTVVGPAFSNEAAQRLASAVSVDGALVDVNLDGVNAFEVAEILRARSIPFTFVTGYGHPSDSRFADVPVLQKPFAASDLRYAVDRMLAA